MPIQVRAFIIHTSHRCQHEVQPTVMPSFDIVSEADAHELANAVDQTNRELSTRFDFKGTDARVEHDDLLLTLHAPSSFQLDQIYDILTTKMAKRGVDIAFLEPGEETEANQRARRTVTVRRGIDQPLAKRIQKRIKESKLKVQASVQGDQVRVTGKKRDDLQAVIALLRDADIEQPLQFENFRD
jgi:uncharacterized protein YajQ (UPF0234 family)